MLAPVLTSIAVVLPAVFAVSELLTLRQYVDRPRRVRRVIRRRVTALFAASAVAAVVASFYWFG